MEYNYFEKSLHFPKIKGAKKNVFSLGIQHPEKYKNYPFSKHKNKQEIIKFSKKETL